MHSQHSTFNRRQALGFGGLAAIAVSTAGCHGRPSTSVDGSAGSSSKLPSYQAPRKLKGEISSGNDFVPLAFEGYPSPPFTSVSGKVGLGGTTTACLLNWGTPPPPLAKNPWHQELDKRLGTQWDPMLVPAESYNTKMAAILASGSIPDLSWIQPDSQEPVAQAVQQGAFMNLSEVLAGDAVKDYPNLASIPTYLWERSSVEGAIYGVPRPLYLLDKVDVYRADWAAKLGYPDPPKNADEVFQLLTAFANGKPRGNVQTWAIGAFGIRIMEFVGNMFHVPNQWRVSKDGSFEYYIETDEYEAALAYVRRLWSAGAFHPDALLFQTQSDKSPDLFTSGRTGFYRPAPASWFGVGASLDELKKNEASADPKLLVTPGHDGGTPLNHQTPGWWGIGAISASSAKDSKRLKELLRILDYWAAPFGSAEYTFLNYGIKGRHFNFNSKGDPVAVDNENLQRELDGNYFVNPSETTLYYPGTKGRTRIAHDYFEKQLAHSIPDPSLGLLSQTYIKKTTTLTNLNTSYENDIVSGRKPFSTLKEWRQRWRTEGGDDIRKEYQESWQHRKGH